MTEIWSMIYIDRWLMQWSQIHCKTWKFASRYSDIDIFDRFHVLQSSWHIAVHHDHLEEGPEIRANPPPSTQHVATDRAQGVTLCSSVVGYCWGVSRDACPIVVSYDDKLWTVYLHYICHFVFRNYCHNISLFQTGKILMFANKD